MVKPKNLKKEVRQIYKIVERTWVIPTHTSGIEFESYWTSLLNSLEEIIKLYHDHGTSDFILHLGCFTYNILRLIGQETLKANDSPLRKCFTEESKRSYRILLHWLQKWPNMQEVYL